MKSQKERSAECYKKRKKNGLCPRCGKKLDRDGYYCTECVQKVRTYNRENRKFFKENGLCPVCGKVKLIGDEKQCIDCREKQYQWKKKPTEEQRKQKNEQFSEYSRNVYAERSAAGICTRCGKRKAIEGKKKCGICLEKDAYAHRKKRFSEKPVREERERLHLCYYCAEPLDLPGSKICKKCWQNLHDKRIANSDSYDYSNHPWKNSNNLIFNN